MRLTRGTFEGPILAALPGVSSAGEFRFVSQGGVLQVSIAGAPYVPIATGVGSSPWQQVGVAVSLLDPLVESVTARLAPASAGPGTPGGDFLVEFAAGDAARGGRMQLDRIEALPPTGAVGVGPYADLLVPAQWGGVFLEAGVALFSATVALQIIVGAWSGILGQRGDVTANSVTPRIQLGAGGGLWKITWGVTIEAVDPATFTFAADFSFLTATRGSASHSMVANDVASFAGTTVFESLGGNEDIRIAYNASAPADFTLLSGYLIAERIS